MEGTKGSFTREQAWYWENGVREDVAREARRTFTSNVNVLSAAGLERGTTELIVCEIRTTDRYGWGPAVSDLG
jgi:hypothetical protein